MAGSGICGVFAQFTADCFYVYFFFFAGVGLFDFLGEWASQPVAGEWLRWLAGDAVRVENFIGGALCLAIFESAFFAEIFRAGVLSVDNGQRDAARSMGLSRWQTQLLVIWPQMFRNIAAPLAGQFILLIKDSAILSVISVQELTFSAQEAAVSSGRIFEMWLLATGFYFALCWPLLWLAESGRAATVWNLRGVWRDSMRRYLWRVVFFA